VQVILINHGRDAFEIQRGDCIAQLVVVPVVQVTWCEAVTLPPTERGGGGFGSTGR
jgi:dUTP pyrophosphatase